MKLTNLTLSRNLDSGRANTYQWFVFLYYVLFVVLVVAYIGVEAGATETFFFFFACLLAGQNFFAIRGLCRVESDLADIKQLIELDLVEAARGESKPDHILKALRESGR